MDTGDWHRVDQADVPDEGRVRSVTVDGRTVALARCGARLGALQNKCPHQGGPLGEGSIEKGWLRCPWHGYDYDPLTGLPPGGFSDGVPSYQVDERADGVYLRLPAVAERGRTVAAVLVETLVAFAASAYGKLTGRPAACFAIAGPGSTNMLTGLYDAKLDQSPVVAISGQVPSKVLGRGAFQDLDLSAVFRDVAAWTTSVHSGSDHAELASLAVKHALDARGVAHLVLPDEVQTQPSDAAAKAPQGRLAARLTRPAESELARAAALIRASRRPVLIAGHGARRAAGQVRALAERLGAPVLTTFKAKGLVPDTHPLGAGVLGRSGTPVASWLMNEADLLIVGETSTQDQRPEVAARWAIWRAEKARRVADDRGRGMSAAAVFDAAPRHLPENAVVTVDVGNHAYSLGRYLESKGQPVLMSGYLGSIGFGYPAALGAWAAAPGRPIVAVTGDGGFGQYAMELTTAVKYGIGVRHVLLDNHSLGKIGRSSSRPASRSGIPRCATRTGPRTRSCAGRPASRPSPGTSSTPR